MLKQRLITALILAPLVLLGLFGLDRHVMHPIFIWYDFRVHDYGGFVRATDDRMVGQFRNRLVTGLCDAVVVVEAGWRSGSLNTAAHAATLGRALGAVPGPVTSAASAGLRFAPSEFRAGPATATPSGRRHGP